MGAGYRTADEALAYEALTMGREVTLVDAHEYEPSRVLCLVYDCEPVDTGGDLGPMYQRRFAVYVDGQPKTSGIVASGFGKPPWGVA